MGRYRRTSSPSPPLAVVALLLLIGFAFFHCGAAAARLLPTPTHVHREKGGAKDDSEGLVVVQKGAAAGNGDELSGSEMMGPDEAAVEEEACDEAGNADDECAQRRLLRDAHLDYIYTQHKGKP